MLRSRHLLLSSHFNFPFTLSHSQNSSLSPHFSSFPLTSLYTPTTPPSPVSAHLRTTPETWLAQLPEFVPEPDTATYPPEEGPFELPPSIPSVFATTDEPTPLQVTTGILLTGAISIFLFRSLRRRAKRAKELKFRSSGVKKSLKEEAVDTLKAMTPAAADAKGPPSPFQTLFGGVAAGVIAVILYKFTTTVENGLNQQTLSDSFSVRQITITIRTIITGVCYLATFIFGINSAGLFLYSGQLAINSLMGDSSGEGTETNDEAQISSNLTEKSPTENPEIGNEDQSSDSTR